MISTRTVAKVAIPVATLGLTAALVVPSIASASSGTAASTSGAASSSTTGHHRAAANGGSVSLTLTAPKAVTRTKDVRVTCTTHNGVYRAATRVKARRIRVRVPSYTGPGSYDKSKVIVHRPRRTVIRSPKAPAVITATGGSYTFDRTVTIRHHKVHMAGTASWTCSSTPSTTS